MGYFSYFSMLEMAYYSDVTEVYEVAKIRHNQGKIAQIPPSLAPRLQTVLTISVGGIDV